MITRLLIANRGEIARRIARTAVAMGIESVAVYAEDDADAPFVTEAERAVPLRGRGPASTYLSAEALVEAALVAGADAVHPGYGFLSERAEFARAVMDAGLTWVGPPAEVISALGDKLQAKQLMAAAGVPVLPTWQPTDDNIVFPVLVKAAAGGGGKGMRVVTAASDLYDAVAAAEREALGAFGDKTVFLERYVTQARHIEIQILADAHGNVVHCFERECSIQRRHQKIIEEAPSPAIDEDLRARMGDTAVAAAKAVGYRGAGTVEFVVEPSGDYWFLEVNTRIQVEHPVTEAVTGLDLVREQLRIAEGAALPFSQPDLNITGHAIEARLYAEDPAVGFLPATGTLAEWAPAVGPDTRWESGVTTGSVVGVEYDPMLAKVISHAPTRQEAAAALALALRRSRIRGVVTNRDFLVDTLRHPEFLAGHTTTDFIERTGVPTSREVTETELHLAVIAAALDRQSRNRAAAPVLRSVPSGWRNSVMPAERMVFEHAGSEITVEYRARRDGAFDFGSSIARLHSLEDGWVSFSRSSSEGPLLYSRHRLHVLSVGRRVWVQGPSGDVPLTLLPRFPERGGEALVAGGLVAPMPGKVVSVSVGIGDAVAAGDLLLIVEAMKMEHRVTAPHAGVVSDVLAQAGEQVDAGALLVVVEEQPQ